MTQSNISIRIDDSIKKKFDNLCDEFGITMSTALNMFVKTVVREQRIPFEISIHSPNSKTIKAIKDVENNIGLSGKFNSVEDAMKSMLEE